jgi:deoxyribodipyrimidine photo-lyase
MAAVSRLSPYLTHGVTDVGEVIARLAGRTNIGWQDKFSFELGWREYFHHVWRTLGDDIWQPQRPLPAFDAIYAYAMPEDVVNASTGVAIIDDQVRELYRSGYLHNHARMWLASYLVHIRKVDWRVGARWMYAYLLDGDLASNTLSWQWVAGTWTGKPYLFNAENVEKYAPGFLHAGTAIDTSYEALDKTARSSTAVMESPQHRAQAKLAQPPIAAPAIFDAACVPQLAAEVGLALSDDLSLTANVELLHPWSLRRRSSQPAIGIIVPAFHAHYPWSKQRWQFVLEAMRETCDSVWIVGDNLPSSLAGVTMNETLNPQYALLIAEFAARGATTHAPPRAFIDPERLQRSFSSFWHRANKEKFPI